MQTYAICFSSMTGNTEILAENLRTVLPEAACVSYGPITDEDSLPSPDVLFVGFWTDHGICDARTRAFLRRVRQSDICLFGTASYGASTDCFNTILARSASLIQPADRYKGGFMTLGKQRDRMRGRWEDRLLRDPDDEAAKRHLAYFDRALGHPNKEDLHHLTQWAVKLWQALSD